MSYFLLLPSGKLNNRLQLDNGLRNFIINERELKEMSASKLAEKKNKYKLGLLKLKQEELRQ